MVPTMYFRSFMPALAEHFVGDVDHDLLLILEFLDAADQRNHDFRNNFHALLGHLHGGFEDGARLHFGDFGIDDAQTAAAEAQHGVELMQLFHALQQLGQHLLQILHFAPNAVAADHFLLGLDVGVGQTSPDRPSALRAWAGIRAAADRACG